jgi:hypothetical protein
MIITISSCVCNRSRTEPVVSLCYLFGWGTPRELAPTANDRKRLRLSHHDSNEKGPESRQIAICLQVPGDKGSAQLAFLTG